MATKGNKPKIKNVDVGAKKPATKPVAKKPSGTEPEIPPCVVTLHPTVQAETLHSLVPPGNWRQPDGLVVAIGHNYAPQPYQYKLVAAPIWGGQTVTTPISGRVYTWCATPKSVVVLDNVARTLRVLLPGAGGEWVVVQTISLEPWMELDAELPASVGCAGERVVLMQNRLQGTVGNQWYDARSIAIECRPDGLLGEQTLAIVGPWVDHGYVNVGPGVGYLPYSVVVPNCSPGKPLRAWDPESPANVLEVGGSPLTNSVGFSGDGTEDVVATCMTPQGIRRVLLSTGGSCLVVTSNPLPEYPPTVTALFGQLSASRWVSCEWNWGQPSEWLDVRLLDSSRWPQVRVIGAGRFEHPEGHVWRDFAVIRTQRGTVALYSYVEGKIRWLAVS